MAHQDVIRNGGGVSWRDVIKIHPAADLFPLMTADELKALGEDEQKNGIQVPIVLWSKTEYGAPVFLLDGRNRLDAAELAGIKVLEVRSDKDNRIDFCFPRRELYGSDVDPFEFVLSANVLRRHLTAEQKRELIAKVLKARPQKSNRLIGEQIKVDHKTVASVRAEQEQRGEIPHLEKTVGKDGKARPAAKPSPEADMKAQALADRRIRTTAPAAKAGTIGPSSAGEVERLTARIEELQNEKRLLELKIMGLESEVEELKARLAVAPAVDVGIPEFLRRAAP
jgi:hypothetical protein